MVGGAIEQGFPLNVVGRELYIAIVVLSRLANHDLSLAVQRLEFRFKLRQEFPDFGINGRGVAYLSDGS